MGFLTKYAQANATRGGQLLRPSPTDNGQGRQIWEQVFGTNKEEGHSRPAPSVGGSHGRTLAGGDASFVQLLKAMRSGAPGGWSDDRYEQWRHFVGVAYVAIHNICKQMSMTEFQVFKRDDLHPDGKRPITRNDPPDPSSPFVQPWDLVELLQRPNNQDSWGRWVYRLTQQKLLTGNALNWLVPNALGVPFEMYIIPTAIAVPQPVIDPQYPNGYWRIQPVYPYGPFSSYPTPYSAVGAAIPAEWMRPHFMFPHPFFRYDGYSPLSALRLHLDEVESIDRSRWYSMQKSFNPAAVLNLDPESEPLPPQEVERIKIEFENSFQGPQNTGQLFVGGPGTSLEQFGIRPQEMDYQSGWDQLVSFSMGAFGITKPAAGMIEDASYSNLYATLKQLDLLTIGPECSDIASELTKHVAPFFGDGLIIEVRCRKIDDHEIIHQKLQLLMAAKAITKNEFRHELEMPLTQEPWGNEIAGMDPMMMQPPALGQPTATPLDEPALELELLDEEERVAYEEAQVDEMENDRPGPDNMARGAGGVREDTPPNNKKKSIMDLMESKSLYERTREACRNGN